GLREMRTSWPGLVTGTAIPPEATHRRWRGPLISTVSERRTIPTMPTSLGLRQLTLNAVRGPPVPGLTWTATGVPLSMGIAPATGTAARAASATTAMSTVRLIGVSIPTKTGRSRYIYVLPDD